MTRPLLPNWIAVTIVVLLFAIIVVSLLSIVYEVVLEIRKRLGA